ncbi:MAG: hypothetical protein V4733_09400 [Verrucomicrobiota bacterium]
MKQWIAHLDDGFCSRRGFALVACLLLMVLLVVITLSFVTIGAAAAKTSAHENARSIARANARFALAVAIGQLQVHTGHDSSTTATAGLLDTRERPEATVDPEIPNPLYLCAFSTERHGPAPGRGLFPRRAQSLPAVLVSGNESYHFPPGIKATAYPTGYSSGMMEPDAANSVIAFDSKDPTDPHAKVRVPRVMLPLQRGAYAYWIADEGMKARVNLQDDERQANGGLASRETAERSAFLSLLAPSRLGIENAGSVESNSVGFLEPFTVVPGLAGKLLTSNGMFHFTGQSEELGRLKHDFTTRSASVLSDPQNGGLKKNLTAACNQDADFIKLITHEGDEADEQSPVFLFKRYSFPPENAEKLTYKEYPGTVWDAFRWHVRGAEWDYKTATKKWGRLAGPEPLVPAHIGDPAHAALLNYWESGLPRSNNLSARLVRRTPVLVRFQMGVDYSIDYQGQVMEGGKTWHEFSLRQHFMPLVIYWNPYDVDLDVTERQEFYYYADRSFNQGNLNTGFALFPASSTDCRVALTDDESNTPREWISTRENDGSIRFFYPCQPKADATKFTLCRIGFKVPEFTVAAGRTKVFGVSGTNKTDFTDDLEPIDSGNELAGYSYYTKHALIHIDGDPSADWRDLIPELRIESFPSEGGGENARVQAKNCSSFQRTNWNINDIVSAAGIRFLPAVLEDGDRLPAADGNGTESPKFAAVLIRKFADMSRYFPEKGEPWPASTNGTDTNRYVAPWNALYNITASRHGAYGAAPGKARAFATPPLYIAGTILGRASYDLVWPEIDSNGEIFTGYNDTAGGGSTKSILFPLPRKETPATGIGSLRNLDTSKWVSNFNGLKPDFASCTDAVQPVTAIGNSFAPPHVPLQQIHSLIQDATGKDQADITAVQYDTSYRYNHALWDRYFLTGERADESIDPQKLLRPPNRSLTPLPGLPAEDFKCPHKSAAGFLLEGGFNVNSISVEAWKTLLSATVGLRTSTADSGDSGLVPFPRLNYSQATPVTSSPVSASDKSLYDGSRYRALTRDEVTRLATEIVKQNKLRGPYATVSDFVNRSLGAATLHRSYARGMPVDDDDVCYEGAIQGAINAAGLNGAFNQSNAAWPPSLAVKNPSAVADFEEGKINPAALKYHSGYGCPGTLTQADVLARIGHLLMARSDTFTIRACGEARNPDGTVAAVAWCEAVVQRFPEYTGGEHPATPPECWKLDPTEVPTTGSWTANPGLGPVSTRLGRRYRMISFRWLANSEL